MTMRLLASPTSPYARLVRVVLAEKRLLEKIQVEMVDPWASPDSLLQLNPLGRIPTLVTEHGLPLTESALIVLYLEQSFAEPPLIPPHSLESVMRRLCLNTLGHKYTHVQSVSKAPMQGALRREWRALSKKRNTAVALWRRSLRAGRKRPSPVLRSLELAGPVLRSRALARGVSDPAERVCICAQGY